MAETSTPAAAPAFTLASELGSYLTISKVPEPVIKALYAALGADAETTLEDIFETPKESVSEGVEKYKKSVADGAVDGSELTPIQVGKIHSTVKKIRALFELPADPLLPPTAVEPPALQPIVISAPENNKRKMSQVLDQQDESTYEKLTPMERAQMRDVHRKVTGDAPPEAERPSSDQLASLKAKLATGEAPYTDFAIWSPFGKRGAKLRKFDAQAFVDNELKSRQLPGPSNYEGPSRQVLATPLPSLSELVLSFRRRVVIRP